MCISAAMYKKIYILIITYHNTYGFFIVFFFTAVYNIPVFLCLFAHFSFCYSHLHTCAEHPRLHLHVQDYYYIHTKPSTFCQTSFKQPNQKQVYSIMPPDFPSILLNFLSTKSHIFVAKFRPMSSACSVFSLKKSKHSTYTLFSVHNVFMQLYRTWHIWGDLLLLLLCSPAISLGFTIFWVRFLRMWSFFNPTFKVVTFCLRGYLGWSREVSSKQRFCGLSNVYSRH